MNPAWDIFCKVVDNFGDIGVCWRLARQLQSEHGARVRLWVDDLAAFRRINGAIDSAAAVQVSHGVEVHRWTDPLPAIEPADVIVETFGCDVPEAYLAAMARRASRPVWINLEYLSAEAWVTGCHGLPSPHPRLPLTRYFFFPGFVEGTGGLLRERGLPQARAAFARSPAAHAALWAQLGLRAPLRDELNALLFCYENPALPELLDCWANGTEAIRCLMPQGRAAQQALAWFGQDAAGGCRRGRLTLQPLPFVDQQRFDELLWACDVKFVRGEDSFVRAQWAAKPFVWHIYPQKENAHWVKLNAFIDSYVAAMEAPAAQALRGFWRSWVGGRGAAANWPAFRAHFERFTTHAQVWAEHQQEREDLAAALVRFCQNLLK